MRPKIGFYSVWRQPPEGEKEEEKEEKKRRKREEKEKKSRPQGASDAPEGRVDPQIRRPQGTKTLKKPGILSVFVPANAPRPSYALSF